uniref:Protein tweety homolog n=1 Tax=Sus scrofa TaxID=9823 RepID=A0A8D1A748_PIG
ALLLLGAAALACLALDLLFLLFYSFWLCCRRRKSEEHLDADCCCTAWCVIIATLVCSAGIAVGFYGNGETSDGIHRATYSLRHANRTVAGVQDRVSGHVGGGPRFLLLSRVCARGGRVRERLPAPVDTTPNLSQVWDTATALNLTAEPSLQSLERQLATRPDPLRAVQRLQGLLKTLLGYAAAIPFWRNPAVSLEVLAEQVDLYDWYRWLGYLGLLLLDVAICLLVLVGLIRSSKGILVGVCLLGVLALIISWGALGLELAVSVGSSDFCVDPDTYVTRMVEEHSVLSGDILQYYVTCSPYATNPFQQKLSGSHKALVEMQDLVAELLRTVPREDPATKEPLLRVQEVLNGTEVNLQHLTALVDCRSLHLVRTASWNPACGWRGEGSSQKQWGGVGGGVRSRGGGVGGAGEAGGAAGGGGGGGGSAQPQSGSPGCQGCSVPACASPSPSPPLGPASGLRAGPHRLLLRRRRGPHLPGPVLLRHSPHVQLHRLQRPAHLAAEEVRGAGRSWNLPQATRHTRAVPSGPRMSWSSDRARALLTS